MKKAGWVPLKVCKKIRVCVCAWVYMWTVKDFEMWDCRQVVCLRKKASFAAELTPDTAAPALQIYRLSENDLSESKTYQSPQNLKFSYKYGCF